MAVACIAQHYRISVLLDQRRWRFWSQNRERDGKIGAGPVMSRLNQDGLSMNSMFEVEEGRQLRPGRPQHGLDGRPAVEPLGLPEGHQTGRAGSQELADLNSQVRQRRRERVRRGDHGRHELEGVQRQHPLARRERVRQEGRGTPRFVREPAAPVLPGQFRHSERGVNVWSRQRCL